MQLGQVIGAAFACWAVAATVLLLGNAYTFGSRELPAPQATLMKTVIEGVLAGDLPWGLVLTGGGKPLEGRGEVFLTEQVADRRHRAAGQELVGEARHVARLVELARGLQVVHQGGDGGVELAVQRRHAVEAVVHDFHVRVDDGVAEAAKTAVKFAQEGVGLSLTVTPCWCYGAETMDMDPLIPKAVWGFNGSDRPGAVYLAAVMAAHAQKGLPAFSIYGRDVQDLGDTTIPEDVQEKLLRFARAGLAVATMRGKSYLSMGGVSMGIAGSIVDHGLFESYLGMRVEAIDLTEMHRRIRDEIYDAEEYERALAWVKANCTEGEDPNDPETRRSPAHLEAEWEMSVKMALIGRDLMIGNPRLAALGYKEEANGHNALAAGFQGQRQWTDHFPNGDFMEAILNTSFDWNGTRSPYVVATENDARVFEDELTYMLVHQKAAPNSPQWFNTGLTWAYGLTGPAQGFWYVDSADGELKASPDSYSRPAPHACFILSVGDDLVNPGGIMDLWVREARIFKFGSGAGSNFSNIRAENELLSGGGKSSGVMSFLRIGDRAAEYAMPSGSKICSWMYWS